MVASEIFKDKKDNYPQSVPKLFVGTRLSEFSSFFSASVWRLIFYAVYSNCFLCVCVQKMGRTSILKCYRLWEMTR